MIGPDGERTIVVVGEPHHPRAGDPLPWDLLARCDAAYFTADDPAALRAARAARVLVATARRRSALAAAGVRADVGRRQRLRRAGGLDARRLPVPPGALVLTEGARGGRVETAAGTLRFPAPPAPPGGGRRVRRRRQLRRRRSPSSSPPGSRSPTPARGPAGTARRCSRGLDPRETQLPLAGP